MRRHRVERAERIAEEAVNIAIDAVEVGHQVMNGFAAQTEEAVDLAKRATAAGRKANDITDGAIKLMKTMSEKLTSGKGSDALLEDELQAFAETFPQWKVTSGFAGNKAIKRYQRHISEEELPAERRSGGSLEHDTYLSLADYEHSDMDVALIFGSYGFFGSYINGREYDITFEAPSAGPITYEDFALVASAEGCLLDKGYIHLVEEAIATV